MDSGSKPVGGYTARALGLYKSKHKEKGRVKKKPPPRSLKVKQIKTHYKRCPSCEKLVLLNNYKKHKTQCRKPY